MPRLVFDRASSLDDPEVFTPGIAVYTHRAASWDAADPGLPHLEGMPPPAEIDRMIS